MTDSRRLWTSMTSLSLTSRESSALCSSSLGRNEVGAGLYDIHCMCCKPRQLAAAALVSASGLAGWFHNLFTHPISQCACQGCLCYSFGGALQGSEKHLSLWQEVKSRCCMLGMDPTDVCFLQKNSFALLSNFCSI